LRRRDSCVCHPAGSFPEVFVSSLDLPS
jgi:hypothetical protein